MDNMKTKIYGIALIAIMAIAASWNFNQNKNKMKLSELALANVEALARGELPEVEIVCSGGSYGMCQYCHRYKVYHPYYGEGYAYECIKSGEQEDWCPSSCNSNGGGSFPA